MDDVAAQHGVLGSDELHRWRRQAIEGSSARSRDVRADRHAMSLQSY